MPPRDPVDRLVGAKIFYRTEDGTTRQENLPMPTMVEVLLFDLGGVLVEFSGVRGMAPLLRIGATESEILEQ